MEIATMATISMVASAAAGAVGAMGAMMQGQAAAQAAQYKASVAKVNEQIAKQNAEYALKAGEYEAYRQGQKTKFQMGQILTTQASRGLDVRGGSAAAVVESAHEVGLQDQGMIRANAARKAYDYEVGGMGQRAEATLQGMAGSSAETAGYIGAAGSILGGVSSVASKWTGATNAGVYGGKNPYDYYMG
jgi:hypothetical protein